MPRGIPNDPAALARKVRRWARYGNIGRLRIAYFAVRNVANNPFYSKRTTYMAEELGIKILQLIDCVSFENAHNQEDTETG